MTEEIKYHKTAQFRQAVKALKDKFSFDGLDDDGNIIRKAIKEPVVKYEGTVKLHGTNACVVVQEDGSFSLHSKAKTLATFTDAGNVIDLLGDNAGFVHEMLGRMANLLCTLRLIQNGLRDDHSYPMKVAGEWCGKGVQSGTGVAQLEQKHWFIFGIKCGDTWLPSSAVDHYSNRDAGITCIENYGLYYVDVDLDMPENTSEILEKLTYDIEAECPVAKALGVTDQLVGEGLVWKPVNIELASDTGLWFKTKGQKHSTSKVKKVASVNPEKMASIRDFVEYAVTENRLNQGLETIELDVKNTGKFIGWVSKDINDEEADTLAESNLTMKDIGSYVSNKARNFFMSKL